MSIVEKYKDVFKELYGNDDLIVNSNIDRYENLLKIYKNNFDENNYSLFSTPGRSELGGNHTDHNFGRVIAASINLDSIAIAAKNNSSEINIISESYDEPFCINLNNLEIDENEKGTTNALVRGIAAKFSELGYNIAGFNAVISSQVIQGSGLSSSASIEILICNIFNFLFNAGDINSEEQAVIAQYTENIYFGKPCGLMDQMACAIGGIIAIDFQDQENPIVERVDFNFETQGYKLLIVNTGGSHEDLTDDYSSIPNEMKSVAKLLGKNVCREIDYNSLIENFSEIRNKVGDRALLRAFHFIEENERVLKQVKALKNNDFNSFLELANNSGNSSSKWLQNIYSIKNVQEQGLSIALALTEKFLSEKEIGACRVHGGGFAGTIQVILPVEYISEYKQIIERIFGSRALKVLSIRDYGSVCFDSFIKT